MPSPIPRRPFYWFCLVLLLLGIGFRVLHLDRKVYWQDEAFTMLYISGYSPVELAAEISDRTVSMQTLQKYQHPSPQRNLADTTQNLLTYNSAHVPIYYSLARLWSQLTGGQPVALRQVAAVISLLSLFWGYWFFQELFRSTPAAGLGLALIAVSPFHVLYGQEAREYSLWILSIFASSALLLRALRQPNRRNWLFYGVAVLLSLYSYFLNLAIVFAHGVYVLCLSRFQWGAIALRQWFYAALLGGLPFLLWLVQVREVNAAKWTAKPFDRLVLLKVWGINLARSFVDSEFTLRNPLTYFALGMLLFIAYAIYLTLRTAPPRIKLFIFVLMGCTALPFALADLVTGGRRTAIFRFVMPTYLCIQMAVVYCFSEHLWPRSPQAVAPSQRNRWRIGLVSVVMLSIISCWQAQQAVYWWNKYDAQDTLAIASYLNQQELPLLITHMAHPCAQCGQLLALSHRVAPDLPLQVLSESPLPPPPPAAIANTFVFSPTKKWRKTLTQAGYTLTKEYRGPDQSLWRLGFPNRWSDRS
ncbi:MAG: hypothetical protein F6J87_01530 [Spirulina sp. SIO3F2]|nr:hypothetical protein [Spirulina sp. SIO3F2]